ncbi:sialate O-acetylesterase [Pedobacter sp. L105]|uniref:sialate O-acetylesterase n=1 Tax=Pedobacter sp. L105 TaxID=1641871 RepID=UPI001C20826D|nr:sialate O-acetylesterase [Pedobacter sp. L105]
MKANPIQFLKNSLLLAILLFGYTVQAKVKLPSVFSNNMVLQQKTNAAIWGKTDAGKTVTIVASWNNKKHYAAKADGNGNWKLFVATPSYGGPYVITISDGDASTLENVLIGDVWVCSGQSNMEFPLAGWGKVNHYQDEIAEAQYPNIRLLQAEHVPSNVPLEDAKVTGGGWQPCSPQSISEFSAVAYFFAREVYKRTGIPIGLIHTSWGGTIAEAWTSGKTLQNMPDFAQAAAQIKNTDQVKSAQDFKQNMEAWQKMIPAKDAGYDHGNPLWAANSFDASSWKSMSLPAFFDQTALPGFDGVVWFRRKVMIPESWAGKALKINLGTIDDNDITWFNGEKIGETEGVEKKRSYTVPGDKVKAGEFVLCVRVFDLIGSGGIYGEKNNLSVQSAGGESISLDGDWQYKAGLNLKDVPAMPVQSDGPNRPTVLFNAMINPFIQFSIRGAIWYQGESNADRAHQYRELFPAMITDWRQQWKIGDFPFYFVQLANYMKTDEQPQASAWAELRDAQLQTLSLPHTGMSVTIDIGDGENIHPKNKQEVGRRLALIALANTYGKQVVYSGPALVSHQITGNSINLDFKFTDGGLVAKDASFVKGFAIAGADHQFHWANAVIRGNEILVSSPDVPSPVAVRYAWGNNPVCNLYNGSGLPASPFRTDDWQDSTFGKH